LTTYQLDFVVLLLISIFRGTQLSAEEVKLVYALRDTDVHVSHISRLLQSSRSAISNVLKRNRGETPKKRAGRPAKISPRTNAILLNQACQGKRTSKE
jgi:IS30 family transposase